MSMVRINWHPDRTDRRKFGISMIVGFFLIGSFFYWKGHLGIAYACYAFGAAAGILGVTATNLVLPIYWAWMGVAFVLGNIMSRVLLALLFFGLFTPLGLVGRLLGRDKLKLKRKAGDSYWCPLADGAKDASEYEKQF